jgi:type II secretion system protein G
MKMQATLDRLQRRRQERGDEGGFTLIELLIVIVILAILAAIVVFAVQNLTGKSTTSACKADYKTLETALEAYKAEVGSYPTALSDLTGTSGTDGPWLKELPASTNYTFSYAYTSGPTYALTQTGATSCP